MHSRLRLVFTEREGKTVLSEQFASGAMRVVRPFAVGEFMLLQIASVTPGIHNGDRYQVEVVAEAGTKVILLNQSATKLHGKRAGEAVQQVHLQVESGAHLEYCPGLTIPFQDAHFQQHTRVDLQEGAGFGMLESWAAGRIERGEMWQFERLSSRVQVDLEGKPLYRDAFEVSGNALHGITDQHGLWASGFWHGLPTLPPVFEEGKNLTGWGITRSGDQYFRMLGSDTLDFQKGVLTFLQRRWRLVSQTEVPWSRYASGWAASHSIQTANPVI